jgi:hypothetical protein
MGNHIFSVVRDVKEFSLENQRSIEKNKVDFILINL